MIKYTKISNMLHKTKENDIKRNRLIGTVVTEKIHGANFSIRMNVQTKELSYNTRRSKLKENDNFYGYKKAINKIDEGELMSVFTKTFSKLDLDTPKELIIFGELFGGHYPNTENLDNKRIQAGVNYTNTTEFLIFDICAVDKNDVKHFLDFTDVIDILRGLETLNYVPILFMGPLKEALNYPNDLESKVPEMYGMEPIENNIMEGVVIKPLREKDPITDYKKRLILKNKNKKFKEKKSKKKKKTKLVLPDEEQNMWNYLNEFITENRVNNYFSKYKLEYIKSTKFIDHIKEIFNDIEEDAGVRVRKGSMLYKKIIRYDLPRVVGPIIANYK